MKLKDRIAIVTGGGRNIGKGIAQALLREGAYVVIADIDEKSALQTVTELGEKARYIKVDVTIEADRKRLVEQVVKEFGTIDILVNNSGILYPNTIDGMTENSWDKTMNINVKGMAFLTKEVASIMKEKKYGRIINLSSKLAFVHYYDSAEYSVSKAAVKSFTEQAAVEYAKYGITVNALAPGYIYTDMTREILSQPELNEKICRRIPIKRIGEPTDLSGAVTFFASDSSAYVTGQTLIIDGGYTLI